MLSGEAGIGKSRLTAALLDAITSEPHIRLRNFCSPQHTDSALYPTIGQIERAAGFTRADTARAKLDKLDELLAQSSTPPQDAALFSELLSLQNDGRYPEPDLTPQQRRQKMFDALIQQVATLSRLNPVLMIFEDAHWADPTSLELFGRLVDRIPSLRVLLVVTFRPEFEPPWIGRAYVTALTVNRLAEREIKAMIDRLVGNKSIPASVRQEILERTDGIPLFVEEMTKAVLEAGNERAAEQTLTTVPLTALALPASLHAGLTRILCGNVSAANAQSDEVVLLAKEKVSPIWEGFGMMNKGCVLHLNDGNAEAIQMITAGMTIYRATRATVHLPFFLSRLSVAYARFGRLDEGSKCIVEALTATETTKERWCEAEVIRTAGEIALTSPERDEAKAQAYFERALSVARKQKAKSGNCAPP